MAHTCYDYCGGRLQGIIDNLKLRGEISEDFEAEIRALRRHFHWIPPGSYVMKCEHGRSFLVRPKL